MRHQGLEASSIRTLVSEHRQVDGAFVKTRSVLEVLDKIILGRFGAGRKLRSLELQTLHDTANAVITEYLDPIDTEFRKIGPTKAHPKGEQLQSCYLAIRNVDPALAGRADLYQLFSLRLYVTRKTVRYDFVDHPFAFVYHAAERFMERTVGTQKAFSETGFHLSQWMPFLEHMRDFAIEKTSGQMNFPAEAGAGLLFGEYVHLPISGKFRVIYSSSGRKMDHVSLSNSQPMTYIARTFVDAGQLGEGQARLMTAMAEWHEGNDVDLMQARQSMAWPFDMDEDLEPCALQDFTVSDLDTIVSYPWFKVVQEAHSKKIRRPARLPGVF